MDRRPTRLIDAGFACAIAVAIVLAVRSRADAVPTMPDGLVATTAAADHPTLDGRIAIAAVFAEIHGPRDFTGWSVRTFERELEERGFRRTSPTRLERADATVDVIALPDDAGTVERALSYVLATHAVVYFNGHNFGGDLALSTPVVETSGARRLNESFPVSHVPYKRPPPELSATRVAPNRMLVVDSCYSAQLYGELGTRVTLVANTERAITGSIYSFLPLLDGLLSRDRRPWSALLAAMNDAALERAGARAHSQFPDPERYVLVRSR